MKQKRTFQPSNIKRSDVINARRAKGRRRLSA